MGCLFFAGYGCDFDLLQAGVAEEAVECAFFKTQPNVGVEFAGFLEVVFAEVEDKELAAGF
jgi:hypothetical protein